MKIEMKKSLLFFAMILFVFTARMPVSGQTIPLPTKESYNFIVISDFGRNGYFNQKEVADMMAGVATESGVSFYVTGGDNFQISGVESTQDPLWMSSFENIYTHPSSLYDWYPALGNHDHGGNVQAEIDYSKISRRWKMPASYYTLVKTKNGVSVRLVILDTEPIVGAFNGTNPNYTKEQSKKQLAWADSVLTVATEQWVIVVGHHPVFSDHPTRGNNEALVAQLNPILNKHNVDFYIGSHDHIFQHLKDPKSKIDYFVNTAASEVRPASSNEMTVFAASSPGFSICSATKTSLSIYFINIEGKAIYQYSRQKK
jgi:hypothetical protein